MGFTACTLLNEPMAVPVAVRRKSVASTLLTGSEKVTRKVCTARLLSLPAATLMVASPGSTPSTNTAELLMGGSVRSTSTRMPLSMLVRLLNSDKFKLAGSPMPLELRKSPSATV